MPNWSPCVTTMSNPSSRSVRHLGQPGPQLRTVGVAVHRGHRRQRLRARSAPPTSPRPRHAGCDPPPGRPRTPPAAAGRGCRRSRRAASRPAAISPPHRLTELDLEPEVVEHPLHDEVHQLRDLRRPMVEARARRAARPRPPRSPSTRLRRCTSESGVSRGTRISRRRSLSVTSAARSIRLRLVPCGDRRDGAHRAGADHHAARCAPSPRRAARRGPCRRTR